MTRRNSFSILLAAGVLAACGSKKDAKDYVMDGQILGLDNRTQSATIQHGRIGDWMEAMTMDYQVKPEAEFKKLKTGDRIRAKVVVSDSGYYVTEVKVYR
jgi:Cu/Ag efflux protein CusF